MKKENVLWSMKLFKIHDKERVFFYTLKGTRLIPTKGSFKTHACQIIN